MGETFGQRRGGRDSVGETLGEEGLCPGPDNTVGETFEERRGERGRRQRREGGAPRCLWIGKSGCGGIVGKRNWGATGSVALPLDRGESSGGEGTAPVEAMFDRCRKILSGSVQTAPSISSKMSHQ